MPPENSAIDNSLLQALVGHNCRRAHVAVLEHVLPRLASLGLSAPSFAVLCLAKDNPGLASSQIGRTLGIRSSNMVALLAALKASQLIVQRPHPTDSRMLGIHLTAAGRRVALRAQRDTVAAERAATAMLSDAEREQLIALLRRIHA